MARTWDDLLRVMARNELTLLKPRHISPEKEEPSRGASSRPCALNKSALEKKLPRDVCA